MLAKVVVARLFGRHECTPKLRRTTSLLTKRWSGSGEDELAGVSGLLRLARIDFLPLRGRTRDPINQKSIPRFSTRR